MPSLRTIQVFIASPGDLVVERRAFKEVIGELNGGFGDGAAVKFVGLGWEDTLATTGRRSQAVINREIDRADVFVLALNRRWGQDAPDAQPFTSYTEEEFHRALVRWGNTRSPEIFVFFKHVDTPSMAEGPTNGNRKRWSAAEKLRIVLTRMEPLWSCYGRWRCWPFRG